MRNNIALSLLHSENPPSLALLIHVPCIMYLPAWLSSWLTTFHVIRLLFFYFLLNIPLNLYCFIVWMDELSKTKHELYLWNATLPDVLVSRVHAPSAIPLTSTLSSSSIFLVWTALSLSSQRVLRLPSLTEQPICWDTLGSTGQSSCIFRRHICLKRDNEAGVGGGWRNEACAWEVYSQPSPSIFSLLHLRLYRKSGSGVITVGSGSGWTGAGWELCLLLLRNSLKVVTFEPEVEAGPFCNMPSFDDFRISRGGDSVSGVKAISQSNLSERDALAWRVQDLRGGSSGGLEEIGGQGGNGRGGGGGGVSEITEE